jgi:predicted amidohydrolase YtcJ
MGTRRSREPQGTSKGQDDTAPRNTGLSRRSLLTGGTAGLAAAVGGAPAALAKGGPPTDGPPDTQLVIVNGKIHTMDAHDRIASAVSIKNGRLATVGDGAHAQGPGTRVINLHGRTVVPGIIDNHNHIVLMGNRPGHHTPLENAYSIADVQAIYAARAAAVPAGSWITTIGGFHSNQFVERRLPTRAELDAVAPAHPVYISIGFAGPSATNGLGKAFFESREVAVGDDGSIAQGSATSGRALLALRQTLLNAAARRQSVLDAMAYAASLGVTTHLDEGAFQATGTEADGAAHEDNFTMHLPFLEVYDEGKGSVRLRINFLHMDTTPDTPTLEQRLKNAFPFFGGDMVRTGGIGEFIATYPPPPWFADAAKRVAQARWRAEVHSLSRTDFQAEIQGFEEAHAVFPITDLRWVVSHVPFITEDYVNRLKSLGGGLSLTGWRYLAGTAVSNGPPFRMIVDNGINVGMSSDGMQIAPMNPWLHMYYAVTGLNARGELINDGQQITRQEVLRLYTADNGWFLREEDQLGSIEPGKLADLVVLNQDYFAVADADIRLIRSVLTVVGGQIVHDEGVVK